MGQLTHYTERGKPLSLCGKANVPENHNASLVTCQVCADDLAEIVANGISRVQFVGGAMLHYTTPLGQKVSARWGASGRYALREVVITGESGKVLQRLMMDPSTFYRQATQKLPGE